MTSQWGSERGAAMLVVATLMGLVAALAAGLSLGASTVALVGRNHAAAAHARATADAGAEHALAVVLAVLPQWPAEGLASPARALPDLLERGRLWEAAAAAAFPRGPQGFGAGSYTVDLIDDDAPARMLSPADVAAIGEDGRAALDANGRVVIRSVASLAQGASATVEAVLGLVPLPVVFLRGSTRIGAATLTGREGRVHVAGDLEITGTLMASGEVEATGWLHAGMRPITPARVAAHTRALPMPDPRPDVMRAASDFVLRADGAIGTAAGAVVCLPGGAECPPASLGWTLVAGQWTLLAVPAGPATVFVEGDASLSPDVAPAETATLSLIATGSVTVSRPFSMRPARRGLLILAGGDVRVDALLSADVEEGLIAAGEQIAILAPARLRGSVLASGRGHSSPLVSLNELSNGVAVASDGGLVAHGWATWKVLGWHRDQAW